MKPFDDVLALVERINVIDVIPLTKEERQELFELLSQALHDYSNARLREIAKRLSDTANESGMPPEVRRVAGYVVQDLRAEASERLVFDEIE